MSFSSYTKAELCRQPITRRCCAQAETYGVLLYCNLFSSGEIRIVTASADFAERAQRLFKRAFNLKLNVGQAEKQTGKITLSLADKPSIRHIFDVFGFDAGRVLSHHVNLGPLEDSCCKASFLRGVFLAGGSISDPEKSYHLELATPHFSVSRETFALLLEMGFAPKDVARAGNHIIYFKQSGAIEDFLTLLGAPRAAMEIMSAKVEKDMRNTINRRVNCDSANADKIVSASQEQLDAIRRIDQKTGLDDLPEKLRETALLRIANPEASLTDLAALALPPVTKSCMGHRLRKLMDLGNTKEEIK